MASGERALLSQYRIDPNDADALLAFDPPAKPWRKVALAVGLLITGTVLLFTGVGLFVTGHDKVIPMLVLGSLTFIPGAYHSRIAYLAYRGYRGYNLSSIPDF